MHNYDDMVVVLNHLHDLEFNNKTILNQTAACV